MNEDLDKRISQLELAVAGLASHVFGTTVHVSELAAGGGHMCWGKPCGGSTAYNDPITGDETSTIYHKADGSAEAEHEYDSDATSKTKVNQIAKANGVKAKHGAGPGGSTVTFSGQHEAVKSALDALNHAGGAAANPADTRSPEEQQAAAEKSKQDYENLKKTDQPSYDHPDTVKARGEWHAAQATVDSLVKEKGWNHPDTLKAKKIADQKFQTTQKVRQGVRDQLLGK